jgi:GxxExxY protein
MIENELADRIMDAAFQIHRELGPGLLESVYEVILARKLTDSGFLSNVRFRYRSNFRG